MKRITKDFTFTEYLVSELSGTDKVLYQKALDASGRAYAPYSRFQVGAAALLENGEVITGCNQENAAYPSGLCAERVALFGAGAAWPDVPVFGAGAAWPDVPVVALAIIACQGGQIKEQIAPCGACCQVMLETEQRSGRPMRILLCGSEYVRVLDSVSTLLPFSFTSFSVISVDKINDKSDA